MARLPNLHDYNLKLPKKRGMASLTAQVTTSIHPKDTIDGASGALHLTIKMCGSKQSARTWSSLLTHICPPRRRSFCSTPLHFAGAQKDLLEAVKHKKMTKWNLDTDFKYGSDGHFDPWHCTHNTRWFLTTTSTFPPVKWCDEMIVFWKKKHLVVQQTWPWTFLQRWRSPWDVSFANGTREWVVLVFWGRVMGVLKAIFHGFLGQKEVKMTTEAVATTHVRRRQQLYGFWYFQCRLELFFACLTNGIVVWRNCIGNIFSKPRSFSTRRRPFFWTKQILTFFVVDGGSERRYCT